MVDEHANPGLDVSVVVPSYRRPESLLRCLDALAVQQRAPRELLVVARGTDTATLEAVAGRPGVRLQLVDVPGLAAAMHAGLRAAVSPVVAFTDDDAEPHPDWVDRISRAYTADESLGALGGRDLVVGDPDRPIPSDRVGSFTRYGRFLGGHHRGTGPPQDVVHLKGVNFTVRRALVEAVDLTGLVRGRGAQHGNELFLCLRVLATGHVVRYDPALVVTHHAEPREDGSARTAADHQQVVDDTGNLVRAVRTNPGVVPLVRVLAFSCLVGEADRPGVAQAVRVALRRRSLAPVRSFLAVLSGVRQGLRRESGTR